MKNLNLKALLPYAIIVILGIFLFINVKRANNLKDDLASEVKLKMALIDTVDRYTNERNELVASKLTLQADYASLNKIKDDLTATQKELLARIKEDGKKISIITAALIKSQITIDSLRNGRVDVDTTKNTVTFSDDTKYLKYNILIGNVRPITAKTPTLVFNDFTMLNDQMVKFYWQNDKKEGYPIKFSVSNSNPYFKTANIESYAIPELDKPTVKPNFWQKNGMLIKQSGSVLISVGIGAGIMYLLMK